MKQRIEDMGYISLEELKEQAKDAETLRLSLEVYEKQTRRSRLRSFFNGLCKKAVYITSVPFYWFIIFKYMMGWFNPGFFMFVILCSIILSVGGGSWGILNFGIRA
ncbi:MAG: hypothetical protein NT001_05775 [Candidatus Woesearchaeota archaeon]|nr:hypothetical protein [Candidatus Woesearchaeota archaeon]